MHSSLLCLGASLGASLVTSVIAAPSFTYVRHEKRNSLPFGWERDKMISGHAVLPMRVALSQSNLDKAEEYLMEVSHPDSPRFGQHWTAKQVAEAFAPKQESVDAVTEWLKNSGIAPERISKSQSMGWLQFDATVAEAEGLLKTRYYLHRHKLTGKPHVACGEYHIPDHLSPTSTSSLQLSTSTPRFHTLLC